VAAHEPTGTQQQPGQAGLDDPAVAPKPLRGLDAFAGNAYNDAASAHLTA